jgi:plastocyanin
MRRLIRSTVAVAAVGAVAVPALASASRSAKVEDYFYSPGKLTVNRGARITWRWVSNNGVSHTVTVKHGPAFFTSKSMKSGSYTFTFRRAGTYHLYCKPHPFMKETVVVR